MPVAVASRSSAGSAARAALDKPRQEITHPALIALHESIPPHFQQAQHSPANHRKNIVSLHRIHAKVSSITEPASGGRLRPIGEKAFNEVFIGCLDRVLPIKKGVPNADRICKFVAGYVAYAQEQFRLQARADRTQARKAAGEPEELDEDEEEIDETVNRLLAWRARIPGPIRAMRALPMTRRATNMLVPRATKRPKMLFCLPLMSVTLCYSGPRRHRIRSGRKMALAIVPRPLP